MTKNLVDRWAKKEVDEALERSRVVGVFGPRQSGKTTLVKGYAGVARHYFSFADDETAEIARTLPKEFLGQSDMAVIDEVQHASSILRAIMLTVDEDQRPGRFLITGSSSMKVMPRYTESLAGRIETFTLHPLSLAEIHGAERTFLEMVFSGNMPRPSSGGSHKLLEVALKGGYPLSALNDNLSHGRHWLSNHVRQILNKDFEELKRFRKSVDIMDVLKVLANCSGSLLSISNVAKKMDVSPDTMREIVGLLEGMYLIKQIRQYRSSMQRQLRKQPKLEFQDSAVLSYALGINPNKIWKHTKSFGKIIESLVFSELQKQNEFIDFKHDIEFYRDKDQREVDFILRTPQDQIVAIEVKASSRFSVSDFTVMRNIAQHIGDEFSTGIVLHGGEHAFEVSERVQTSGKHRFWHLPISCLWDSRPSQENEG